MATIHLESFNPVPGGKRTDKGTGTMTGNGTDRLISVAASRGSNGVVLPAGYYEKSGVDRASGNTIYKKQPF